MNSSKESRVTIPVDVNSPFYQAFWKKRFCVGFYKS